MMEVRNNGQPDLVLQAVLMLGQRLTALEAKVADIHQVVLAQRIEKESYSTREVADALRKTDYTVRERWCNEGRIDCEKDPESGRWRIPGHEYQRLIGGGTLRAKRK